jgi:uncharacterized YigZ family protein
LPDHPDAYLTLAKPSQGIYKEKGSKFIAYAIPLSTHEQIGQFLNDIKEKHRNARHHCYAWKIGKGEGITRVNDDGEPSGTAGKPIMGRILSHHLTQTLIVVVRYFGGTKLGTGGLIRAYKQAAEDAITQAGVKTKYFTCLQKIGFSYALLSQVMHWLDKNNIQVIKRDFQEYCTLEVALPESDAESLILQLRLLSASIQMLPNS